MLVLQDRFGNAIEEGAFICYSTGGSASRMEVGMVERVACKESKYGSGRKWTVRIKKFNVHSSYNWCDVNPVHTNIKMYTTTTSLSLIKNIIVLPDSYLDSNLNASKMLRTPKSSDIVEYDGSYTDHELNVLAMAAGVYEAEVDETAKVVKRMVEC